MTTFGPAELPFEEYYSCRFDVLRKPIGFPRGSEILADDDQALHSYIKIGSRVVAVGRAHVIPNDSDGSQADHAGPGATQCPPFGPLAGGGLRPAIQIRQMGTRTEFQRRGLASKVLAELESGSVESFGAKVGFLQARINAVPFYQAQGWKIIDEPYDIKGIGPHRSMMKIFSPNQ